MENEDARKAIEMIEKKTETTIDSAYVFVRKYYTSVIYQALGKSDWGQVNIASGGMFVTATSLTREQVQKRVEWMLESKGVYSARV